MCACARVYVRVYKCPNILAYGGEQPIGSVEYINATLGACSC